MLMKLPRLLSLDNESHSAASLNNCLIPDRSFVPTPVHDYAIAIQEALITEKELQNTLAAYVTRTSVATIARIAAIVAPHVVFHQVNLLTWRLAP